jgi:hypothetical protein
MPLPLAAHALPREPAQLAMDERQEGIERVFVAGTPLLEEPSYSRRGHHEAPPL